MSDTIRLGQIFAQIEKKVEAQAKVVQEKTDIIVAKMEAFLVELRETDARRKQEMAKLPPLEESLEDLRETTQEAFKAIYRGCIFLAVVILVGLYLINYT